MAPRCRSIDSYGTTLLPGGGSSDRDGTTLL
jgi:hypothetical protein